MNKMNLLDESKIIVTLPEEPIQDEEGNLTFTLKDNTLSLGFIQYIKVLSCNG